MKKLWQVEAKESDFQQNDISQRILLKKHFSDLKQRYVIFNKDAFSEGILLKKHFGGLKRKAIFSTKRCFQ